MRKPSEELNDGDRRVLYNRFHALKNRASDKGIPFAWKERGGFEEFYLAMKRRQPDNYSLASHQMRFSPEELNPSGKGYCEETMSFHAYRSDGKVIRRTNVSKNYKKSLMSQADIGKLCVVASALTLILMQEEGGANALILKALAEAGVTNFQNPSVQEIRDAA